MSLLSLLHALPDSSSVDVAPKLSPSSLAVAARDSGSASVMLKAVFSLVPSVVGGTRQSDQSCRHSSIPLHNVGPFYVVGEHLGAWRR